MFPKQHEGLPALTGTHLITSAQGSGGTSRAFGEGGVPLIWDVAGAQAMGVIGAEGLRSETQTVISATPQRCRTAAS